MKLRNASHVLPHSESRLSSSNSISNHCLLVNPWVKCATRSEWSICAFPQSRALESEYLQTTGRALHSNRIVSKTKKSFWSCSHMNCCLQKILHINLHIIYIIHIKASSKIQESRKSNKYIKSYKQNNVFNILINLLSICNIFEFQATQIFR